jgi:hypothetical protein
MIYLIIISQSTIDHQIRNQIQILPSMRQNMLFQLIDFHAPRVIVVHLLNDGVDKVLQELRLVPAEKFAQAAPDHHFDLVKGEGFLTPSTQPLQDGLQPRLGGLADANAHYFEELLPSDCAGGVADMADQLISAVYL